MDSRSSSFGSRQQQQRLSKGQYGGRDTDACSSDTLSMQSSHPGGLYDDMSNLALSDYSQSLSMSIGFRPSFPYQMNAAQEAKAAAARAAAAATTASLASAASVPPTNRAATPARVYSDGSPRRKAMGTPRRLFGGLKKVEEEKFMDIRPEPVFSYNPTGGGRRRSCCQEHCGCLGMCLLLLVCILALTSFILFITLRPHPPAYDLQDAIVSSLSILPQDPADNSTFLGAVVPLEELGKPKRLRFGMDHLALTIRNRNSISSFVYRTAQLDVLYEDKQLRQLQVQGFRQNARGERLVEFSLPVEEVLVEGPPARNITLDFERGLVSIGLKAAITVGVTMFGLIPLPSYQSALSCFINVTLNLSSDVVSVNSKGCSPS